MAEEGSNGYRLPEKCVLSPSDINKWESSEAYQDILGFLTAANDSIKGKKLNAEFIQSPALLQIHKIVEKFSEWVDEIPPVDQDQRYGNKAFRDFYTKICEGSEQLLKEHLEEQHHGAVVELRVYLSESLGNSTRIDYGTGHELSFVMFLCCLHKIGALSRQDLPATVAVLFKSYIDLCRKLQTTYKMEPAGSQGVWSLDDYQFVPFIWGSAQLVVHPKFAPESLANESIVKEHAHEYLFFACIKYILEVKSGPFAEHSNQLWNISGVGSWSKVNQGLFKMYKAEILNKFPVIQHVLFGSLLSFDEAKKAPLNPTAGFGPSKMPPSALASIRPGIGPLTGIKGPLGLASSMPPPPPLNKPNEPGQPS